MDPALKRLMKKMPPPPNPPYSEVDWTRLESVTGLIYPASFKEFISVYGLSVWFDDLSPFCTEAKTDGDVKTFLASVKKRLKWLEGNIYDEQYHALDVPFYPEEGGLFPFMMDYSGNLFTWRTDHQDPNKWPVICWLRGPVRVCSKRGDVGIMKYAT